MEHGEAERVQYLPEHVLRDLGVGQYVYELHDLVVQILKQRAPDHHVAATDLDRVVRVPERAADVANPVPVTDHQDVVRVRTEAVVTKALTPVAQPGTSS